jgi:NAD(P)-dependent dehydrogenase (short-subunit alcohol dehydrogenase family)
MSNRFAIAYLLDPEASYNTGTTLVAKKPVAELLERVVAAGGQAGFYEVDITSSPDVDRSVRVVWNDLGPVDILVNNAAIPGTSRLTHEATAADFDQVFAVNVKGTFLCTKFVVANMLAERRKGSVVNISSTYGVVGNADIPLYHATKAAVLMMTKSDGVIYAEQGIRTDKPFDQEKCMHVLLYRRSWHGVRNYGDFCSRSDH